MPDAQSQTAGPGRDRCPTEILGGSCFAMRKTAGNIGGFILGGASQDETYRRMRPKHSAIRPSSRTKALGEAPAGWGKRQPPRLDRLGDCCHLPEIHPITKPPEPRAKQKANKGVQVLICAKTIASHCRKNGKGQKGRKKGKVKGRKNRGGDGDALQGQRR